MFDIYVNGQLAAIVAEGLVKLFVETLIKNLGLEFSITTKRHPEPEAPVEEAPKKSK